MPNFDKTGPEGKGPKTGMQRGKCEGAEPKQGTRGQGRGRRNCPRRGFGRGFGFRNKSGE